MAFFDRFVQPYRIGEKNFERGRTAEFRRDETKAAAYFATAATAFDDHLRKKTAAHKDVRPSHLVMAGICYARTGRFEDALHTLETCLEAKDIPDAFLHAGYAAAKLGKTKTAIAHWTHYPDWAGQRIISTALKTILRTIQSADEPDLQFACEAVANAIRAQDAYNRVDRNFRDRGQRDREHRQGY
ncbi:hypothetical protein GO013_13025 [Pseudodesulfovibrio sp. JC047]|uniref:hypothetical protein n=1 Tax=Pseudodesulfovibrio sp. JC047 TaxID=2683199 RepID=UPI0013D329A3|nr:hypothetical protein [Pseudodesulfovibrio sp. JC047]NDV20332.1 hypothetical protein [Pseudodesulfovibrio sp. JC047]